MSWRFRVRDCKITVSVIESTVEKLETSFRLFTEIEDLGLNPDFLDYGEDDSEEDLPAESAGDTTPPPLSPTLTEEDEYNSDESYSIFQPKRGRIQ